MFCRIKGAPPEGGEGEGEEEEVLVTGGIDDVVRCTLLSSSFSEEGFDFMTAVMT